MFLYSAILSTSLVLNECSRRQRGGCREVEKGTIQCASPVWHQLNSCNCFLAKKGQDIHWPMSEYYIGGIKAISINVTSAMVIYCHLIANLFFYRCNDYVSKYLIYISIFSPLAMQSIQLHFSSLVI